jgi:DNA polymerase III delta prime subunit
LWRRILADPGTKKNGRLGQPQAGVDIYGQRSPTGAWWGIQCKLKAGYPHSSLSTDEIEKEIAKAAAFTPALSHFVIATTAKRDSDLQLFVRNLSDHRRLEGFFSVDVIAWDDIIDYFDEYPDIAAPYIYNAPPLILFDEWLFGEDDRKSLGQRFVRPHEYENAKRILQDNRCLLLAGPTGVGKQTTALALATEQKEEKVYRVPHSAKWCDIATARPGRAFIIIPNFLGQIRFDRFDIVDQIRHLEHLRDSGTSLILTSPHDVLVAADREVRLTSELLRLSKADHIYLGLDSYSIKAKKELFKRCVEQAASELAISPTQRSWAIGLVDGTVRSDAAQQAPVLLRHLLEKSWLPVDITTFIDGSLRQAASEEQLLTLLQQEADIDQRCSNWFQALDESIRIFVLAVAILPGTSPSDLWNRYKLMSNLLRTLNPDIAALPIGIARRKAAPYVTRKGNLEFENARLYRAVIGTLSRDYCEYILELKVLLLAWTVPENRNETDEQQSREVVRQTEDVRTAIARLVGEIAKHRFTDAVSILDVWACDRSILIRKAVGVALRETISQPTAVQEVLKILAAWATDFSSDSSSVKHRASAASALWRLVMDSAGDEVWNFVMDFLRRLARDPDELVAGSACNSLKMCVRYSGLSLDDIEDTLYRLADRSREYTRVEVVDILRDLAYQNDPSVSIVLASWLDSGKRHICWTGIYAVLTESRLNRLVPMPRLFKAAGSDPLSFWRAFERATENEKSPQARMAFGLLREMIQPEVELRKQLVVTLAQCHEAYAELADSLNRKLFASDEPDIASLPEEVLAEIKIQDISLVSGLFAVYRL